MVNYFNIHEYTSTTIHEIFVKDILRNYPTIKEIEFMRSMWNVGVDVRIESFPTWERLCIGEMQ